MSSGWLHTKFKYKRQFLIHLLSNAYGNVKRKTFNTPKAIHAFRLLLNATLCYQILYWSHWQNTLLLANPIITLMSFIIENSAYIHLLYLYSVCYVCKYIHLIEEKSETLQLSSLYKRNLASYIFFYTYKNMLFKLL